MTYFHIHQAQSFILREAITHNFRNQEEYKHIYVAMIGSDNGKYSKSKIGRNLIDDFLNPRVSESFTFDEEKAYLLENALPINFGISDHSVKEKYDTNKKYLNEIKENNIKTSNVINATHHITDNNVNEKDEYIDLIKKNQQFSECTHADETKGIFTSNPYLSVISQIPPSDLISKFTSTAHWRVKDAVRATIWGLVGNLNRMEFETTTVVTFEKLASLMLQLQMTGYMFKNAEYRLNRNHGVGKSAFKITGASEFDGRNIYDLGQPNNFEETKLSDGRIRGQLKVFYHGVSDSCKKPWNNFSNLTNADNLITNKHLKVDAEAYVSELRSGIHSLRDQLNSVRQAKEDAIQKDLLLYIRTLPELELKSLTSTMSEDILLAMKGFVNVVISGIIGEKVGSDGVTEQSGEAISHLCMWQLVVGYNFRELEIRENIQTSFNRE